MVAAVILLFGGSVAHVLNEKKENLKQKNVAGIVSAELVQREASEENVIPDPYSVEIFSMDTVMTFTAYGERRKEALTDAKKEVQRLDALLSVGNRKSEISIINENGKGYVTKDAADLITRANEFYRKTDGLFDCTIYPVMDLWGFTTQNYHVPTESELQTALTLVDGSKVMLENPGEAPVATVTLAKGQKIDLGGIGKGFTSDRLMELLAQHGIISAIVSLGGNVQVLNTKPDGTPWKVGIQDPADRQGAILGVLEVTDKAVITSGGYERYFEEDGKTYIHIIDPRTGWPVENDLSSVTIVSADGTLADALSTSLYIMGFEDAAAYWKESADPFDVIFVKKDGSIIITEGIADAFETERKVIVLS